MKKTFLFVPVIVILLSFIINNTKAASASKDLPISFAENYHWTNSYISILKSTNCLVPFEVKDKERFFYTWCLNNSLTDGPFLSDFNFKKNGKLESISQMYVLNKFFSDFEKKAALDDMIDRKTTGYFLPTKNFSNLLSLIKTKSAPKDIYTAQILIDKISSVCGKPYKFMDGDFSYEKPSFSDEKGIQIYDNPDIKKTILIAFFKNCNDTDVTAKFYKYENKKFLVLDLRKSKK